MCPSGEVGATAGCKAPGHDGDPYPREGVNGPGVVVVTHPHDEIEFGKKKKKTVCAELFDCGPNAGRLFEKDYDQNLSVWTESQS